MKWLISHFCIAVTFLGAQQSTFAAPTPAPTLVSAELRTKTAVHGDNKDHDTGVFVLVTAKDGKTALASVANADNNNKPYNDGSTNSLSVPLSRQGIEKTSCEHFKFKIGIVAQGNTLGNIALDLNQLITDQRIDSGHGNDKWNFDAWLILHFSDGSTLIADKLGQTLNSRNGKIDWLRLQ